MQLEEQRRLEEAIHQQAMENNRSNDFVDLSNIQQDRGESRGHLSGMQSKIDAMNASSNRGSRLDQSRAKAESRLSRMHDVSDISNPHALRNNYLEKSQLDAVTD